MIETERLILRGWRAADVAPFHAMGQDEDVMRYIGPLLSCNQAQASFERMRDMQAALGHCFWAVERRTDGAFIGFCGLKPGAAATPIADDVEIGWRLARATWGQGFAIEAARASLDWGWHNLPAETIAAITVPANRRSWGLMERLEMKRDVTGDFDHPALAADDPLRQHITHRAARPQ